MERLFLLFKVEKGCRQADAGQTVSHAEAEKRMHQWLKRNSPRQLPNHLSLKESSGGNIDRLPQRAAFEY
ncbi:MAG: hypothetical protein NTV22_06695 [bacterium]|nr:hypothetical protein [bacterium]